MQIGIAGSSILPTYAAVITLISMFLVKVVAHRYCQTTEIL